MLMSAGAGQDLDLRWKWKQESLQEERWDMGGLGIGTHPYPINKLKW